MASQSLDGTRGLHLQTPTVRFAPADQEIEPSQDLLHVPSTTADSQSTALGPQIHPDMREEIRILSASLHGSHIQHQRLNTFAFEPVSLPTSRVPSNDSTPYQSSREQTRSDNNSSRPVQSDSALTTPPLTPRSTQAFDTAAVSSSPVNLATADSPGKTLGSDRSEGLQDSDRVSSQTDKLGVFQPSRGTTTTLNHPDGGATRRPSSPMTDAQKAGIATPPGGLSRKSVVLPAGEKNDPYARSRRPPQPRSTADIDSRFVFGNENRRRSGIFGSSDALNTSLPRVASGRDLKSEHRKSTFSLFGGKEHISGDETEKDKHHGSMSDLKRFFGMGAHHNKGKRTASPAPLAKKSRERSAGNSTPPRRLPSEHVPFADDHGLEKKYGKFGKILGSGAGGSVRVLRRANDGRTFAVKKFRERHAHESTRDYNKKVTAEFCIGSTLHHGNIIETLDIIQEGGHWYEVMEYAPYDLFAIVMTGRMSREEVTCCFLQITKGVAFLHNSGLAHRDLKLDNVVVNEHGIMKIIDFGSASVFKYPFENDIILATGIVGSDPYLAPEVYDERHYDPQPTDVWSLAIIFACMSLRRFPWKAPRVTDNSYKLFISEPHTKPEETSVKPSMPNQVVDDQAKEDITTQEKHHQDHGHGGAKKSVADATKDSNKPQDVIRGPWRLLRLLPRESRTIIGAMLRSDPHSRATMSDILAEPWIENAPVCEQDEVGNIIRAGTHTHVLEPGTATQDAKK